MAEENWERGMLERLATEGLLEQQRARRWGIFFKLLTFALVFFVLCSGARVDIGATDRVCLDKCTAMVELAASSTATRAPAPTTSSPACRPRSRTRARTASS